MSEVPWFCWCGIETVPHSPVGLDGLPAGVIAFLDPLRAEAPYRDAIAPGRSLQSAIAAPERRHHYTGERDLTTLAAHLLVAVNRAHALIDGNKRAAMSLTDEFLRANGHYLDGDDADLAELGWAAGAGIISLDETAAAIGALITPGRPTHAFEERSPGVMRDLAFGGPAV